MFVKKVKLVLSFKRTLLNVTSTQHADNSNYKKNYSKITTLVYRTSTVFCYFGDCTTYALQLIDCPNLISIYNYRQYLE